MRVFLTDDCAYPYNYPGYYNGYPEYPGYYNRFPEYPGYNKCYRFDRFDRCDCHRRFRFDNGFRPY